MKNVERQLGCRTGQLVFRSLQNAAARDANFPAQPRVDIRCQP